MTSRITKLFAAAAVVMVLFAGYSFAADKVQKETTIKTSAFTWESKNSLENEINDIEGVTDAYLDIDEQVFTITYDGEKVSADQLVYTITDLGYTAEVMETKDLKKKDDNKASAKIKEPSMN